MERAPSLEGEGDVFVYSRAVCLFVCGCAGSSLLPGLFSSSRKLGYSLVAACGLLIAVDSLVAEHGL